MSRTPIREALSVLEQEGFVRSVPRRGLHRGAQVEARDGRDDHRLGGDREHGRPPRRAARDRRRSSPELRTRWSMCSRRTRRSRSANTRDANMEFHKAIIRMGGVELMTSLTDNLFIHMRAVRAVTMTQDNRAQRSIADHRDIIAALERRDADAGRAAGARTHDGAGGACRAARRFSRPDGRRRTTNGAGNTHREKNICPQQLTQHGAECRSERRSRTDGRVPPGHRRAEAERHQDDL